MEEQVSNQAKDTIFILIQYKGTYELVSPWLQRAWTVVS